jgi:hypothetical protein
MICLAIRLVGEIRLVGVSQGHARHLECDVEDAKSLGVKPLAVGEVRPDGHGKPRELAPYPQTWPAKSIELEPQMIF